MELENGKILEILKILFNIEILIIRLYVSYRLVKSGYNDLKETHKLR